MKNSISLLIFLLSFCILLSNCATTHQSPGENQQQSYGILSEGDYNLDNYSTEVKWRCFPLEDVKVKYRTWRDADPLGPYDVIVTMCDFEIHAETKELRNEYGNRRAYENTFCKDFKKGWDRLTKSEHFICIEGEDMGLDKKDPKRPTPKPVNSWIWNRVKTKKGMYCYFGGPC